MCTLILYHRSREDWPLLVAANRDERLERPASPPRALPGPLRIWAGVDREAGGTWLGLNARGLVVGLTNAARSVRDPSRRSRGLLVLDLLREESAQAASALLVEIAPADYNPFQIVVADPWRAWLGSLNDRMSVEPLAPGAHVLTNAAPGDPEEPRRAEVVRLLGVDGAAETKTIEDLQRILARHAPVPERSVCLHRPSFGTRSATLIAVGGRRAPLYLHAEGPPCRTAWEDLSPARGEVRVAASSRHAVRPGPGSSASTPRAASRPRPASRSRGRPARASRARRAVT